MAPPCRLIHKLGAISSFPFEGALVKRKTFFQDTGRLPLLRLAHKKIETANRLPQKRIELPLHSFQSARFKENK